MAGDPCRLARRHSSSADPHRRLPCDARDAAAGVDAPPTGTDARVRSDPLRCQRSRPARRPTIRATAVGLFGGRSCLRRARTACGQRGDAPAAASTGSVLALLASDATVSLLTMPANPESAVSPVYLMPIRDQGPTV
jgi:hypothetical protein